MSLWFDWCLVKLLNSGSVLVPAHLLFYTFSGGLHHGLRCLRSMKYFLLTSFPHTDARGTVPPSVRLTRLDGAADESVASITSVGHLTVAGERAGWRFEKTVLHSDRKWTGTTCYNNQFILITRLKGNRYSIHGYIFNRILRNDDNFFRATRRGKA